MAGPVLTITFLYSGLAATRIVTIKENTSVVDKAMLWTSIDETLREYVVLVLMLIAK